MLRINFNHNCVRRLNQPQTDISKPWPLDSSQRARFLATNIKTDNVYTTGSWWSVWVEYRRPRPMEASAQRRRPMAMETSAQAIMTWMAWMQLAACLAAHIIAHDIYIYFQMYSVSGKFLKTQELYIYNWRTVPQIYYIQLYINFSSVYHLLYNIIKVIYVIKFICIHGSSVCDSSP